MNKQKNQINCQFLTAQGVGEILGLSKRTVFRLNSSGKIPKPVRISGSVRWKLEEIQRWISLDCPDRHTFEAMGGDN